MIQVCVIASVRIGRAGLSDIAVAGDGHAPAAVGARFASIVETRSSGKREGDVNHALACLIAESRVQPAPGDATWNRPSCLFGLDALVCRTLPWPGRAHPGLNRDRWATGRYLARRRCAHIPIKVPKLRADWQKPWGDKRAEQRYIFRNTTNRVVLL
jgi:hypothetical protein